MTLNLSRMSHGELRSRLRAIDPNLVFENRKNNVRMYKILQEHVRKHIIPRALGGSEETVDNLLREDLSKERVDFSTMISKTLQEYLKGVKFKRHS